MCGGGFAPPANINELIGAVPQSGAQPQDQSEADRKVRDLPHIRGQSPLKAHDFSFLLSAFCLLPSAFCRSAAAPDLSRQSSIDPRQSFGQRKHIVDNRIANLTVEIT